MTAAQDTLAPPGGPLPHPAGRRWPRLDPRRRGVLAVVLVALAAATLIQSFSWNQTSHYALVRALAHGTAQIDRWQDTTGDKALFHGHWYSARAPGLAIYLLPWYGVLTAVDAPGLARSSPAQRNDDEMIWALGLAGNVLPLLGLLLLLRSLAQRLEPGYGTATAVAAGLATLLLPLGTLLFSHVFAAALGFAAFALLWGDRDGPPRLWRPALAGLALGYAMTAEYPLLFVAVVLAAYAALGPWDVATALRRLVALGAGAAVGVVPLALYDRWAFGSIWHVAYADLPPHQAGFFGIRPPSLSAFATLLFSSRGLLTLSPILVLGGAGAVLMHRRGRRAEAYVIASVVVLYLLYNSGYYLPFGGAVPGPRFLITIVPFLALPLGIAFRRWPGPAIALAAISATAMILATLTHPLVGYQPETFVWTHLVTQDNFQPTIVSAFGGGRGVPAVLPFVLLAVAAIVLAVRLVPRPALSARTLATGAALALAWGVAATFIPAALGIDAVSEREIAAAGDPNVALQHGSRPLLQLAIDAAIVALVALAAAAVASRRRPRDGAAG